MPEIDAPAAVLTYFDAINRDQWDRLDEALAPDVVIAPPGMDEVHGLEAAKVHYPTLLAGFHEHDDRPTRVLPSGDSVVVEIDFEGRTDAGQAITFKAVDVFDLVDGRIARVSIWYDTHGVRRQLKA